MKWYCSSTGDIDSDNYWGTLGAFDSPSPRLEDIFAPADFKPYSRAARRKKKVDARHRGRKGEKKPVFYDRRMQP